jgi:DNA repair protein RadC
LKFIHARISEQNIKDEFLTISKELLHRSNVRSQTKDVDEYLQASYEEGETTMKLFLLLLNKDNILEKDEAYLQWVS